MNSPLVNKQKTMEQSTIFNGKIHYFYGPFSIAMLNYQRVIDHENAFKTSENVWLFGRDYGP
jgi:hypothetical protein